MASVTLWIFSSLSSSRRWTSACNCGVQVKYYVNSNTTETTLTVLTDREWQRKSVKTEVRGPQDAWIFSPLLGSSSWMWPCVRWRPLSPPEAPAVGPTAAGSSLCDSHTSPHSLSYVPRAARATEHTAASGDVLLRLNSDEKKCWITSYSHQISASQLSLPGFNLKVK